MAIKEDFNKEGYISFLEKYNNIYIDQIQERDLIFYRREDFHDDNEPSEILSISSVEKIDYNPEVPEEVINNGYEDHWGFAICRKAIAFDIREQKVVHIRLQFSINGPLDRICIAVIFDGYDEFNGNEYPHEENVYGIVKAGSYLKSKFCASSFRGRVYER